MVVYIIVSVIHGHTNIKFNTGVYNQTAITNKIYIKSHKLHPQNLETEMLTEKLGALKSIIQNQLHEYRHVLCLL